MRATGTADLDVAESRGPSGRGNRQLGRSVVGAGVGCLGVNPSEVGEVVEVSVLADNDKSGRDQFRPVITQGASALPTEWRPEVLPFVEAVAGRTPVPSREPDDRDIFTILAGGRSAEPVDAKEPFQAGFVDSSSDRSGHSPTRPRRKTHRSVRQVSHAVGRDQLSRSNRPAVAAHGQPLLR